jgi:hypothetical protein
MSIFFETSSLAACAAVQGWHVPFLVPEALSGALLGPLLVDASHMAALLIA